MEDMMSIGKRKDNGKWIEGYYWMDYPYECITPRNWKDMTEHYIRVQNNMDWGLTTQEDFEVIPESVGRYTGMKDENDKKCYSGDILKFIYQDKEHIGVVKFECGMYIVCCNDLDDGYISLFDISDYDGRAAWIVGEKIGNKFDNPEMLEK